jgi:integrase
MREMANAYIESRRHRRTFVDIEIRANFLVNHFGPNTLIRSVSPLSIAHFVQEFREGRANKTVNNYLGDLRAMLNLAVSERWIDVNPVSLKSKSGVPLFLKANNERTRTLTPDEEERLLPCCSDELRPIVIFALDTGCRLGEILDLTWDSIDFGLGLVRAWQTKTEREKTIPLSRRLREILLDLKAKSDSELVFPSPRPKDKHTELGERYTSIKTAWNAACRRARVTGLRFHDLRATFISRLIEKGVDIGTIKTLPGHTTLAALQRYVRISEDAKRKAIEKLSELAA